jgi:hypothetical protein
MILALVVVVALSLYLSSCTSPEDTRQRGGGPGADVGNRTKIVQIHEGARPFENTPKMIPTKHPPLAPASQADELTRR